MKTAFLRRGSSRGVLAALTLFITTSAIPTRADQVEMQNGDRYTGKILSLESNTVVLNSDFLGTLRLRRDHIASMSFGAKPTTATAPAPNAVPKAPAVPVASPAAGPNPQVDLNSSLGQQIAANPNLVSEIRSQVLAGAGPKATAKYDSIVGGLSSGSLNIADVRKEAASVAAQLRELRGSGDDESAAIFDEYLSILDSFVAETQTVTTPAKPVNAAKPPVAKAQASSPTAVAKPSAEPKLDDE